MQEYNFQRIENNSYKKIKKLLFRSFGLRKSMSFIKSKYDTNIFGAANIGYFAYDKNLRPAAYYGVFPIKIIIDSQEYLAAQSGDTMTDPLHRNKGLFTQLALKTYNLAKENNIQLIYGFPNNNSLPGFVKKLNWNITGYMQDFTLINKSWPLYELCSKFKFLLPLYHIICYLKLSRYKIELTENDVNKFNQEIITNCVKKDINFFIYKLRNKHNRFIKIWDFNLIINTQFHLLIGAVGYFDKDRTDDFIDVLKLLSKKIGCKTVIISVNKKHWLYDYLFEKIVPVEKTPIGFYSINPNIDFKKISFSLVDYDTF